MGLMLDFRSKVDGKEYRASVVPVKKKFHIAGPKEMRFLDTSFDSFIEMVIHKKTNPLVGFFKMFFPPEYLVEINDSLNSLGADKLPFFCQDILENELFFIMLRRKE